MTSSDSGQVGPPDTAWSRWQRRYRQAIKPNANDLPNRNVLLAFPAIVLLATVILIAFGITGSSSGVLYSQIATGSDPNLIAGHPQVTRSDEWNVQTVWAIDQIQQGLPVTNETFPGGMDATLPQDLPRVDWSVAFRPHLLGFMLMDANHAFAWKWWVPAAALIIAAYVFFVSVLPRRPAVAAMLSIAFYFSPLFQWWFLSTTLWPVCWGLAVMAAVIWATKSSSWRSRWIWGLIVAYLTVVMATGIYAPFIIPIALVVACLAASLFVERIRRGERWKPALGRFLPVLLGGIVASAVTVVWLLTKAKTVEAFLNTAYPGTREAPTGTGDVLSFVSNIASSFTPALNSGKGGFLGPNSSEASTFFYVGLFLLPVVGWAIARQIHRRARWPWALIGLTVGVVVLLAYVYLPGWDALAHLLFLDKTTAGRVRIGLGVGSIALLVYVIRYLDDQRVRARWLLAITPAVLFLVSQVVVAIAAGRLAPFMLQAAPRWWFWAALSALAIMLYSRSMVRAATVAFLVVAVAGSGLTNPIYRGVVDLRDTAVSKRVIAIDRQMNDATWVGVGSSLTTAILLESGATAYNGFQGAPSRSMWRAIDPTNHYTFQWNRLAGVSWVPGAGEPTVSNPAADQIVVTFDGCSAFAQEHVDYVLSDRGDLQNKCLTKDDGFRLPKSTMTIYRVTPAA